MSSTMTTCFETIDVNTISACGAYDIPWKKVGEYAAPLMPYGLGVPYMNKGASVQAATWGAAGALGGGLTSGPVGALVGGTTSAAAAYYGALLNRDFPVE